MTTVVKLSITLYAKDEKVTGLGECNSADIVELTQNIEQFINSTMKKYGRDGKPLTREQRIELNKLFGMDDAINVDVDDLEDTIKATAEGKFTNDFLASNLGKKIPFSTATTQRKYADPDDEDGKDGGDCLTQITHIMLEKATGGRRRKRTRRHRRRSTRRRATRKA